MIGDVGGEISTDLPLRIGDRGNAKLLESGLGKGRCHGPVAGNLLHPHPVEDQGRDRYDAHDR